MKKLTDREIFKSACYAEDKKKFYNELIASGGISDQNFWLHGDKIAHKYHNPSTTCRYCKKDVVESDFDIYVGYWEPHLWFICHKDCLSKQKKLESYECQLIDKNCNDCRYMIRDKEKQDYWNDWTRLNLGKKSDINYGKCQKYNKDISFIPVNSMDNECFEHRNLELAKLEDIGL